MNYFSAINDDLWSVFTKHRTKLAAPGCGIASAENINKQIMTIIPAENLRSNGPIFLGHILVIAAIATLSKPVTANSVYLDTICGVGKLLNALERYLLRIYAFIDSMNLSYLSIRRHKCL